MDYDQNPIQVFSSHSFEEMKEFQKFHARKRRPVALPAMILCVVMITFLLVFYIGVLHHPFTYAISDNLVPFVLFVFGFFLFLASYNAWFYTRKRHAAVTKLVRNGQLLSFCNYDIAYNSEQSDYVGQGRTAYSMIDRVYETRDVFYLYISKNQAYVVSKLGFRSGNPDELRALLQSHVPPKKYKMV